MSSKLDFISISSKTFKVEEKVKICQESGFCMLEDRSKALIK
jgi:hypothetical protein